MKRPLLALVHTSATLVPVFSKLCRERLPGIETLNLVDDSLVKAIHARGSLAPDIARRVLSLMMSAEQSGADYILVTCSSVGPAVEASQPFIGVPVLRVDQPMADAAVKLGTRIGVVATLRTTLNPTTELVRRRAAQAGVEVEIESVLCEGAFEALMNGDTATHDRKVSEALQGISSKVDVVLLAQASMARVAEALPANARRVPILASPPISIDHLATIL